MPELPEFVVARPSRKTDNELNSVLATIPASNEVGRETAAV